MPLPTTEGCLLAPDARMVFVHEYRCRRCGTVNKSFAQFRQPLTPAQKERALIEAFAKRPLQVHQCGGPDEGYMGVADLIGGAFQFAIHVATAVPIAPPTP